jgi:hypothetical protein
MLKDTEYEAIGRLAPAFNEVETVIDEYCPHILGASEWEVATVLWDKKANFDQKGTVLQMSSWLSHNTTDHSKSLRTQLSNY